MSKIVALSEAASIALHAVVCIAQSPDRMNVIEIAERIGSSKHHVAKVMQRLVKEGMISSNRGPSGGFILKVDPKEVTLLQIYEAIEGKVEVHRCAADKEICPFGKCLLNNVSAHLTQEFIRYMEGQKLDFYLR